MRIWRLNRRLTAREPHEITGYSERTHREIGKFNGLTLKLYNRLSVDKEKPQNMMKI